MAYMTDIQQSAQAALPVIPNNGNPNGAHNMPVTPQVASAEPAVPQDPLAWLRPSDYMQDIKTLLQEQNKRLLTDMNTQKGLFNIVPRENGFNIQQLDDAGVPMPSVEHDGVIEVPIMPYAAPADDIPPEMPEMYKQMLRNGQLQ